MMFDVHAIARLSALGIVDSVAQGTVIALFAVLVSRVSRKQNARVRFAVWFSTLIAIALAPLFSASWRSHASSVLAIRPEITVPESWALWLFVAWSLMVACFLVGVARALWHLHKLRNTCIPVTPAELDPLLQETLSSGLTRRKTLLCASDKVRVPTVIGLMKPAVVIPRWVLAELSPAEINQILLHELAHLRRWDDWTNLLQQIVKAIFFFHPAVWWIENKIALEREMACDDAVLAQVSSPRAYAECLAHLAERSFVQRTVALAQAALGHVRQTSLRVAQILDVNRPSLGRRSWKPAASLVASLAIACSVFVSRTPRLIGFDDPAKSTQAMNVSHAPGTAAISSTNIQPDGSSMPPIIQANAKVEGRPHTRTLAMRSRVVKPHGMVHLASSRTVRPPATQAVFVVVESTTDLSSDQQVYRIQMWRVMILRRAVDPSGDKVPPKQT